MEIININPYNVSQSADCAVVGFYYRNGLFDETDTNRGISYVLDHVIYCMLYDAIENSGDGHVRCFTNYGHSAILIICAPNRLADIICRANDKIFREKLDFCKGYIQQWIDYKSASIRGRRLPADILYYSHRVSASPLARAISSGLNMVPSIDKLELWRSTYMHEACVSAYISGNTSQMPSSRYTHFSADSLLPSVDVDQLTLPKHIQWRRSQILYAVPCNIFASNFLAAEAFCQWMNPILSAEIRKNRGQFQASLIHPDFFQEWQISFQCPKGTERIFTEQVIPQAVLTTQITSENKIRTIRRNIEMHYHRMAHNPVEWNRFAGYNAVSGRRLCLDSLFSKATYEEHITSERISAFLLEIQAQRNVSVFATAVR